MIRPTFLFIGPDKSGSSWMYKILSQHPDAYVPLAKDTYYFDRYYDKGLKWYLSHFADAPPDAKAIGELSHDYLFSATAAARIHQDLPDITLIVCLRNPVARSLSQFQYMRRGGEVGSDFDVAVNAYPKIVENSRYLENLRTYIKIFGRDRVKVMVFEDLIANPQAFGKDFLTAVGLRDDVDLPYQERVRTAGMARNPLLSRTLKAGANVARHVGLANLVGRIKHAPAVQLAYREIKPSERVTLTPAQNAALWAIFEPEIPALSELIGRDLRFWIPKQDTP